MAMYLGSFAVRKLESCMILNHRVVLGTWALPSHHGISVSSSFVDAVSHSKLH